MVETGTVWIFTEKSCRVHREQNADDDETARREEKRKTQKEVYRCSEIGHTRRERDAERCRGLE